MANYGSFITAIIHGNNNFRPLRKAIINYDDMNTIIRGHKIFNLSTTYPHIYRSIDAGMYTCKFEDDEPDKFYLMDIFYPIKSAHKGTRVVVYNPDWIEYRTQNDKFAVRTYEIEQQNPITDDVFIEKTINGNFTTLILAGKSTYEDREPSIDNPIKIINRNNIELISTNADNTLNDTILLDNIPDLISLPTGERDYMVIDSAMNKAYIIKRCDGYKLTGDAIVRVDAYTPVDKSYYVFFVKNENAEFVGDINNIVCTHFKTVKFTDLVNKDYKENCIAISDDWKFRHEGFFIKISADTASNIAELADFITLQNLNNTPIEMIYSLMDEKYQIVIPTSYELKTFFGGTNLIIPDGYGASCCYYTYKEA